MTDTIKHFGQQTFFNSVLCLVSCSSKNQVPYFILNKGCDPLKFDTSAAQEKTKTKTKNKNKTKKVKKKMHLGQVFQSVTSFETQFLFFFFFSHFSENGLLLVCRHIV